MSKRKQPRPEYLVPSREPAPKDSIICPFETVKIGKEETYSLDHTMARFILPRLKLYREDIDRSGISWGVFSELPDKHEQTRAVLDIMIAGFQIMASEDYWLDRYDPDKQAQIQVGLEMFAKYYQCLWW